MRSVGFFLVLSVASVVSASASAWPASSGTTRRGNAVALHLAFGVDGCTDDWCDHVDPLVFGRFAGGLRLYDFLSVDLQTDFFFGNPESVDTYHPDLYWALFLGPEMRGILPLDRLTSIPADVWMGLGLGWMRTEAKGTFDLGILGKHSDTTVANGVALAWGFGMDEVLLKTLGLGLAFWLHKPWFDESCSSLADKCDDVDNDKVGVIWNFGLHVAYYLPVAL